MCSASGSETWGEMIGYVHHMGGKSDSPSSTRMSCPLSVECRYLWWRIFVCPTGWGTNACSEPLPRYWDSGEPLALSREPFISEAGLRRKRTNARSEVTLRPKELGR